MSEISFERSSEALNDQMAYLEERLEGKLDGASIMFGELTLACSRENVMDVLRTLRDDSQTVFNCLIDLCGVDYPERDARFDVVYHLLSPRENMRIRVKIAVGEDDPVPSIVPLFPAAEWYEREVYDLFGVIFSGHPDLRRLLTDYGFEGHPLRKDFPLSGFVEVRYDDLERRVVYEPIELRQEFRNFDFLSPWEGTEYVLPGDEKTNKNLN